MSKHYIRLDRKNIIIKGFSDDFEQPLDSDICINKNGGRHFELNAMINSSLINDKGVYLYKYKDGNVLQRTADEIKADEASIPKPHKSDFEILKETIDMLILSSLGGN